MNRFLLAVIVLATTMGHGDGCCSGGEETELGPRTGATCATPGALTYANFGQSFMESYCTRCHSSTLTGEDRMGATLYHDFDSLLGIMRVSEHVDQMAGSGPDATNTQMPPDEPRPSLAERQMLAEWIACGLP